MPDIYICLAQVATPECHKGTMLIEFELNEMSQWNPNKELFRDPKGHSVPEDGRIYSEQLHEQIGAELFIKQVGKPSKNVLFRNFSEM